MCAGTFPASDPSSLSLASLTPRQVSGKGWFAEPWSVWVTVPLECAISPACENSPYQINIMKKKKKIKPQSPKTAGGVSWCICGACRSLGPGDPLVICHGIVPERTRKAAGKEGAEGRDRSLALLWSLFARPSGAGVCSAGTPPPHCASLCSSQWFSLRTCWRRGWTPTTSPCWDWETLSFRVRTEGG